MTIPDVVAKIKGSIICEVSRSRALVVLLWEAGRCLRRRDQISPTMTSRARVAAKRVRSSVRPACGLAPSLLSTGGFELASMLASVLGRAGRED